MSNLVFISLRWLDVLDILIVAGLLYQLYHLLKGTTAIRIFLGILTLLIVWRITVTLQMELISGILGQFLGIGVIAVIIIFQPEIRTFLNRLGTNRLWQDFVKQKQWNISFFNESDELNKAGINKIVHAVFMLATDKTGALIIIPNKSDLLSIIDTGTTLDARLSAALLESVFFKNNPLHDGAVVCTPQTILAARCRLPLSQREDIDPKLGMRHRAAVGLTEQTDALAIVVSEENGLVHTVEQGRINRVYSEEELIGKITNLLS